MRATCEPLDPAAQRAGRIPVLGDGGRELCALWTQVLERPCSDRHLRLQVIAIEPMELPAAEPSESATGALARLERALRGSGALIALLNPAVFPPAQIALAEGARLFALADAADEASWDAVLSLGLPVYGLRGRIACACLTAHPGAVLSALAYGNFACEEGLALERLDEDRAGVAWRTGVPAEATVIVRGGYEAARQQGAEGRWADRGNEAYVRLVIRSAGGTCWTQPRFIAPRAGQPAQQQHGH
ncbi:MAG: hypothetical protein H0X38_12165 [Planctomycetes bacterium]|nr:hypothetical protein [Planctomycetota bacterium]